MMSGPWSCRATRYDCGEHGCSEIYIRLFAHTVLPKFQTLLASKFAQRIVHRLFFLVGVGRGLRTALKVFVSLGLLTVPVKIDIPDCFIKYTLEISLSQS